MKHFSKILSLGAVAAMFASCGCNGETAEKKISESNEETTEQVTAETVQECEETESASPANDWDSVLDEYERFVDKYINVFKKASSGDMNALTEYASYMEKAQNLAEKLDAANDEMTSAQMNRYMKITQKMASAASAF